MTLPDATQAKKRLYAVGKELMGENSGGLISRLLTACNEDVWRAWYTMHEIQLDPPGGSVRAYLSGMLKTQGARPMRDREVKAQCHCNVPPEHAERWQQAAKQIADTNTPLYRTWFEPLTLMGVDESGRFFFKAPSKFHAGQVRDRFNQYLEGGLGAEIEVYG